MQRVVIVGAGIAGCATALELALRGVEVQVLERTAFAAEAASTRAAGILGAQLARHPDEATARLCVQSRDRYPSWLRSLASSGIDVGYRRTGSMQVVTGDPDPLAREVDAQRALGLDAELLGGAAVRALEPELSEEVTAAAHYPGDALVDPPRLLEAVRRAAELAGAVLSVSSPVERVLTLGGAVRGVRLADGREIGADEVVIAAGAWSASIGQAGLAARDVRPARGQMIELRAARAPLARVVEGPGAYLSPRDDGRVLVGSTVEDAGFDPSVTAGAVSALLAAALRLVPSLGAARLAATWSGFRARSRDDRPILGRAAPGLVIATGHFRDGILLAPITAAIVAAVVLGEPPPVDAAPFAPERLSR